MKQTKLVKEITGKIQIIKINPLKKTNKNTPKKEKYNSLRNMRNKIVPTTKKIVMLMPRSKSLTLSHMFSRRYSSCRR